MENSKTWHSVYAILVWPHNIRRGLSSAFVNPINKTPRPAYKPSVFLPYTLTETPEICPNLLKDKQDLDMMVAAQGFFLKAFENGPLADKWEAVLIPSSDQQSDEALASHCKRFVKTNTTPLAPPKWSPTQIQWPFFTLGCRFEALRI